MMKLMEEVGKGLARIVVIWGLYLVCEELKEIRQELRHYIEIYHEDS